MVIVLTRRHPHPASFDAVRKEIAVVFAALTPARTSIARAWVEGSAVGGAVGTGSYDRAR